MTAKKVTSMEPVIPDDVRILILGSMPGAESLLKQQYYAFERNFFWPIMYKLTGAESRDPWNETYMQRLVRLAEYRIGLWDVMQQCLREGSLDGNIREAVPNPIEELLALHPGISVIGCNGSTAYRHLSRIAGKAKGSVKDTGFTWHGVEVLRLPSSSPVPSAQYRTMQDRLRVWSQLLPWIIGDQSSPSNS
jgi:hypoxanthine-DNA glycosylase